MTDRPIPDELKDIRQRIDQLDRELVTLLAKRFALTREVGLLKASNSLEAVDAHREAEKLAEIRALCETHDLNPDLVAELLSQIMREAAHNHQEIKRTSGQGRPPTVEPEQN